ncbi:MAG TPA: fibronectin type III domain-containing protein [Ilumatobacteraceae bacterium]|nr:fibronectin type III domain-containing protein [Ilumatobacteraceae bacterium]
MSIQRSTKLIPLVTSCAAIAVTVIVTIPHSPVSADVGGGTPGMARRAAAVLASGLDHTCARLSDGSVKCWGVNDHGQLGQGDSVNRGDQLGEMGDDLPPVDLGAGRTAISVAAGRYHSCALLDDHTVKCWGAGANGQLGQGGVADLGDGPGELGDNLDAIELGTGRTATAIAAGWYHNCAILDDGSVKCWGSNNFGTLGRGGGGDIGEQPGEMGDALPPVDLGTGRTATAIAAGLAGTCAILDDGSVKCWGANSHGQLGLGDVEHRGDDLGEMGDALLPIDLGTGRVAVAISAGNSHMCAILDNGSLKCWGWSLAGQLGQGDTEARGDEPGEMGDALLPIDLGGGLAPSGVSAAGHHTCAVIGLGDVKCWGENQSGELGQGDLADRGDGAGEMGIALAEVDLGTGRAATAVASGGNHSCALLDDFTVKCWGRNFDGQLGQSHTDNLGNAAGEMGDALPPIDVGTRDAVTAVATGVAHSCAILDTGEVKCWGENASGQLGLGDTSDRGNGPGEMGAVLPAVGLGSGRTATAIATGNGHTCAILDTGAVKCWGENGNGQLGQGDTADRGDSAGEMGDNLAPIDLGTGRTATAIAAGGGHTCAVLDDGDIKCWGQNGSGQLAQGDTATRGDGPGEMGDNLDPTNLFPDAIAIAAGQLHTCALFDGGDVFCWGQNVLGQLGQESTDNWGDGGLEALNAIELGTGRTAIAIAAGGYHSCAVLDDGTAKCWGANGSGNLGQGDTATRGDGAGEMGDSLDPIDLGTGRTAISVGAGLEHSCATLDDGTAKCWGENGSGQLGLDSTSDRGNAVNEMGDNLDPIDLGTGRTAMALAGGFGHSCALSDSRAVRCWGGNTQGQLGQGDIVARGDNVGEMATLLPVRLAGNSHVSPILDVPLSPTGVAAVADITSATVTWVTPADDGGRPIVGYRVQSAPAGAATWTTRIENSGSPATSALVTGLVAGAGVRFRVAAINVTGTGPYSSPSPAVVPAVVPAAPGTGSSGKDLVTVPPARLLDTRQPNSTVDGLHAGGGAALAGSITEVQITGRGGVPSDAIGAILNVTIVDAHAAGYATVFGCTGTIPTASNLNYSEGLTIANNTIVKLSPSGGVCIYTDAAAHVLVDVNGYLPADSHVGTVVPARLLDTRQPNSTVDGLHAGGGPAPASSVTEVQITGRGGVPTDAVAAIVNVTVVGPAHDGFATIFPCLPVPPTASNLNYSAGRDIPNGAVVQLSPHGSVCVFTDASAHLLIDVNGYLPAGTTVGTLAPARLLDTRQPNSTVDGLHAGGGQAPAGSVTEVQITGRGGVPTDAVAAILNVTVVGAHSDGFATVFDCAATVPTASNVNYTTGRDIPNNTVSKLSASGTVCIYTDAAAHLLLDVNGYAS